MVTKALSRLQQLQELQAWQETVSQTLSSAGQAQAASPAGSDASSVRPAEARPAVPEGGVASSAALEARPLRRSLQPSLSAIQEASERAGSDACTPRAACGSSIALDETAAAAGEEGTPGDSELQHLLAVRHKLEASLQEVQKRIRQQTSAASNSGEEAIPVWRPGSGGSGASSGGYGGEDGRCTGFPTVDNPLFNASRPSTALSVQHSLAGGEQAEPAEGPWCDQPGCGAQGPGGLVAAAECAAGGSPQQLQWQHSSEAVVQASPSLSGWSGGAAPSLGSEFGLRMGGTTEEEVSLCWGSGWEARAVFLQRQRQAAVLLAPDHQVNPIPCCRWLGFCAAASPTLNRKLPQQGHGHGRGSALQLKRVGQGSSGRHGLRPCKASLQFWVCANVWIRGKGCLAGTMQALPVHISACTTSCLTRCLTRFAALHAAAGREGPALHSHQPLQPQRRQRARWLHLPPRDAAASQQAQQRPGGAGSPASTKACTASPPRASSGPVAAARQALAQLRGSLDLDAILDSAEPSPQASCASSSGRAEEGARGAEAAAEPFAGGQSAHSPGSPSADLCRLRVSSRPGSPDVEGCIREAVQGSVTQVRARGGSCCGCCWLLVPVQLFVHALCGSQRTQPMLRLRQRLAYTGL